MTSRYPILLKRNMAIYGDNCPGRFFLLSGNEIIGDYSSPVQITETFLGEPFVIYAYLGVATPTYNHDPRPRYNSYVYSAAGAVIAQLPSIDKSNPWTITPPSNEQELWTISWSAYGFYAYRGYWEWQQRAGGSLTTTINRYSYSITQIP